MGGRDGVEVYWLDPDTRRVRGSYRERERRVRTWVRPGEGHGTEPRILVAMGAERFKVRDFRFAVSRLHPRVGPLHQHRDPVRDAPHPHDGALVPRRRRQRYRWRRWRLRQRRRYVHEQSRLDMQRLTRRRGIAGRMYMLGRLWIGVTGSLEVMQAVQAEIGLWVQSPVRDHPGDDLKMKAVVRQV